MDEIVSVIAGDWRCGKDGQWKFKIAKDVKIRNIAISSDLCFDQLERMVIKAFRLDTSKQHLRMSFWSPNVSNICTQTNLPPVALESDSDVVQFTRILSTCSGLNIFATFEDRESLLPEVDNVVPIQSVPEPILDCSIDDITLFKCCEEMEAAFLKKMGKKPADVGHVDVDRVVVSQEYLGSTPPATGNNPSDTDHLFNQLASLVEKEAMNMSTGSPSSGKRSKPSASCSNSPGFSLGIEGLDGPTPFSLEKDEDESSDDFDDKNTECPTLVDENHSIFTDPPPNDDNLLVDEDDEEDLVGRVFESKNDLHRWLANAAIEQMFCYKIKKSCRKRVIAVCVDKNCPWRLYATSQKDSENFEVRTYIGDHYCGVKSRSRFGEKATSRVLAELLQSKYTDGKNGPRACDIPDLIRSEHNLSISYMKAWHAKEVALAKARGNDEQSFKLLSTYLRLLKEHNPGSITVMSTDTDSLGHTHFKFLFVSFGPSISGVPFLRKVVVIDGTQMKGKYKGCLVVASCQDGNMQIFPLAFGIVDSENEKSWTWFLQNLSEVIEDSSDLVFVSDRCPSIYVALAKVYPKARHGSCTVHLYRNIKAKFKNEGLAAIFSKAARAYTVAEFNHWWSEIQIRPPACAQWLVDIGFTHWSLCHFPGQRYNIMSSNIAESVNAALAKAVSYPIISMLEFVRTMIMKWFSTRRELSGRTQTRCTPIVEGILVKHLQQAVQFSVRTASQWIYQVNDTSGQVFTVDFQSKTCTCRVFQVLKIPCCHAVAAQRNNNLDVYTLVDINYSTAYWQQLYHEVIMPVPRADMAALTQGPTDVDIYPPLTKRPPGRPRKVRIPSRGEGWFTVGLSRNTKCGRCQGTGHNKATCKNPI